VAGAHLTVSQGMGASQQVGGYPAYCGCDANVAATAAHDPKRSVDTKLALLLIQSAKKKMSCLPDFMAGGESYQINYEANLTKSTGTMRAEVYGA